MGSVGGTGPLLLFAAMADFPEPQADQLFNWQEILIVIILFHKIIMKQLLIHEYEIPNKNQEFFLVTIGYIIL